MLPDCPDWIARGSSTRVMSKPYRVYVSLCSAGVEGVGVVARCGGDGIEIRGKDRIGLRGARNTALWGDVWFPDAFGAMEALGIPAGAMARSKVDEQHLPQLCAKGKVSLTSLISLMGYLPIPCGSGRTIRQDCWLRNE